MSRMIPLIILLVLPLAACNTVYESPTPLQKTAGKAVEQNQISTVELKEAVEDTSMNADNEDGEYTELSSAGRLPFNELYDTDGFVAEPPG